MSDAGPSHAGTRVDGPVSGSSTITSKQAAAASPDGRDGAQNGAEAKIRGGKLAGKSLPAAIAILAIPVLLEQFANATVGLVDTGLTGHLPDAIATPALDGVGIASYIRWFIGICTAAVGLGGMALIARAIGAGDRQLAHRALGQAVIFGTIWGVFVGAALWLAVPLITSWGNLSSEAAEYCGQYIRITAMGLPATSLLFAIMMCSHGAGETTRPFLIMLVVNIVNIVVSWALSGVDFTFGDSFELINPFTFDMHVRGIAAGTVAGRVVGALLILLMMTRGIKDLRLELSALRPHLGVLRRIVRVGLPNFLEGMGMWFGNFFILYEIGRIAAKSDQAQGLMGAHLIAIQWEAFSYLPGFALGTAAGTLAGQFLGAGNPRMAGRSVVVCTILGMLLMGSMGLVFIFAGSWLTSLISDDPVHLRLTPQLLLICGVIQVFFALAMVIRQALRSTGDTAACMVITWISTYAIRIPLAWFLGYTLGFGLVGVWIGMCGELILRGLFFLARFLQGRWKLVRV